MRWAIVVCTAVVVSGVVWAAAALAYGQDAAVSATVAGAVFAAVFAVGTQWATRVQSGGRAGEPVLPMEEERQHTVSAVPTAAPPASAVGSAGQAQQVVVGDVPGEAVGWQDRSVLLDRLTVMAGTGRTVVVCALAGQRGIGKTQLAAAYTRARIAEGWPVVVWVVADTETNLITGLDRLAAQVGMRQPDADTVTGARAALGWLRNQPGPCLVVFDNAVDADLIRAWTPTVGAVHTVVTTTLRTFENLGVLLDVGLFDSAEAVTYLHTRTGLVGGLDDPDGTIVAKLAEALGRLPLALACAGAVIGPRRRYRSYRAYLDQLSTTPVGEALPRPTGDPYPHGTAEAILLAIDDLAVTDPEGRARALLDRLAVLAPTGVDSTLLAHLCDDVSIAGLLAERSLTIAADDADRTVVHRLVQRVVCEQNQHADRIEHLLVDTADRVQAAVEQTGDRWDTRTRVADYAQHTHALTKRKASEVTERHLLHLRQSVQYWLARVHNSSSAVYLGASLVADLQRLVGRDHPDTLTCAHNLAVGYQATDRLDDAIVLYKRTLADRRRVLGPDHPDTLKTGNNLASAYRANGLVDKSIELHEQTLAYRQLVLGPYHPDTLGSRHNLANAYAATVGRLQAAIDLHERTLADRQRILGPDDPETLRSCNNLASAYQAAGRLSEAIALHERTLGDRQRTLGPDHPDTLRSRNNLAVAYQATQRLDDAIRLHEQNWADRVRVLGRDHPDTLISRSNLANALAQRDQK